MATTVYILLGSNLGDREKNLYSALDKIEAIPGLEVVATSAIYLSEAQEMEGESPAFMNQAVMADYLYLPHELLNELEKIEKKMGRTDKGKMKPRIIDLDILLFGDEIVQTKQLSIPHKKLLKRPFAMIPVLQITPNIVHPVKKEPIADFLTDKDHQEIILYKDHVARNI
ncbi:MAG: 2-amino-4-hydroxy-6-hydroxymethyldihydropteridine diphosphokinase [FCB group bacterium]|nr:2-amino-4-hydroxy-6-hydroxymethyldihydropteridine diphosphokinase [FCB group bacterium]